MQQRKGHKYINKNILTNTPRLHVYLHVHKYIILKGIVWISVFYQAKKISTPDLKNITEITTAGLLGNLQCT